MTRRNNLLIFQSRYISRLRENYFYNNKLSFHFSISLLLSFVSLHIAIWFLINSALLSSSLATAVKSLFMRGPIPRCVCQSIQRSILGNFCFSGKAWFTAVNKLGLDGGHVQLLSLGNLIQVSVPILKTQFGSIF